MFNQDYSSIAQTETNNNQIFFSQTNNNISVNKKRHDYCFQKLENPKKRYSQFGIQLKTKNLDFPLKGDVNSKKYQSNKYSKNNIPLKQDDFYDSQNGKKNRSNSVILDLPLKKQSRGSSVITSQLKSYSISDVRKLQNDANPDEQEKDLKIKSLEQMNHYYRNLITKMMNTTEQDKRNQNIYKSLNQVYFEAQNFEKQQKAIFQQQIYQLQKQNDLNQDIIKKLEFKAKDQERLRESSKERQQKYDILQSEINVLNEIIKSKNQEIEKQLTNEQTLIQDNKKLLKQVSDLNSLVNAKNKSILQYQNQIEELNQNISQQQKSFSLDQQKNVIQKTTLQNYEKRIYNLNLQIKETQQELQNKQREVQEYKNINRSLQLDSHKSNNLRLTEQKNYENLIQQVSQLNQEKVQSQQHIQQLTQLLKQKDFQIKGLEKDLNNLKEEIAFLEQFQLDQSKVQQSEKFLEVLKREIDETQNQKKQEKLFIDDQQNYEEPKKDIQNDSIIKLMKQKEDLYKQELQQFQIQNQDYQDDFYQLFEVMKCFPVDKQQLEELIHKKQDNPQFVLKFILQQIEELVEDKDFQINRLQKILKKKQLQFFEEKEQLQSQLQDYSHMSKMNDKSEKESCISSNQFSDLNQQDLVKQLEYYKHQNKVLVGQNLQLKQYNKSIKTDFKTSAKSAKNKQDSSFLTQRGKKYNLDEPLQLFQKLLIIQNNFT